LVVLPAEREIPNDWDDVAFLQALHYDGSICTSTCRCVDLDDRTKIRRGEELHVGEWTWYGGDASWLVGWRRICPTAEEQRLTKRIELLDEDLEHEAGMHHLTKEALAELTDRIARLRASIRRSTTKNRELKVARAQRTAALVLTAVALLIAAAALTF
ncbi:hypothetical protein, partial [Glycomyces rutgersensis]